MHTKAQIEQYIWDYIDGHCTPEEKAMVEDLLRHDQQWRTIYEELRFVNAEIQSADLVDQPSMRFTKDIMDQVNNLKVAPPAQSYINKKIIYGIAIFFGLVLIGTLVYAISQIDFSSGSSNSGLNIDMSKWTFDPKPYLNSTVFNIFMFFNVIAGLALLDRYLRKGGRWKQEGGS
ncbi:MAG: zf-HC2 domain-containing protein [Sphingobacteriales bacterium]|nr:MAG: zf-HC2 domain-containing protein [Sphingobacteriales bacterium]